MRPPPTPHYETPFNRRDFLARAGGGFGGLALAGLLAQDGFAATPTDVTARRSHFKPTARNVIFLFMEGGPSHIDLFDPKPLLNDLNGERMPKSFGSVITAMGEPNAPLLGSKRKWKQCGQAGIWMSDWIPHMRTIADDICVIRSCVADGLNHVSSVCQMNTGSLRAGRPSLGAWVSYGLGTENQNLPAFMVLLDGKKRPLGGSRNWGAGFMPATFQGTTMVPGAEEIANLSNPSGVSRKRQREKLDFLNTLNRSHQAGREFQSQLDARINAYELAYRMQMAAPEATDLSSESEATKAMYGIGKERTNNMARSCLLARRMVERGVRFVQVYSGAGSRWDAHSNIESNHTTMCGEMDQPVTALIKDLKQRGLLDETLVVWGGEFGRTPMSEKGTGRDHNPFGFTMWMAGGGVKGGQVIGTTDDIGLRAQTEKAHVRDLHATILHAIGLDHMSLNFTNNGRKENLTINEGGPVMKVFGQT